MPENSDDDISDDEDNEILQNRPENDSAIETANLRNFPDLLRLNISGQDTNSGITHSTREIATTHSGARPKEPWHIGPGPRRINPPFSEVILPQLKQRPYQKGVCVPPYDEPQEPWCGFGSQDQLMDFLSERIPSCDEEHSDTNTTKMVNEGRNIHNPIEEIEKYIHSGGNSD